MADAKSQLNIHALWRHFGFEGEAKKSCRSPFREDCNPSFSVNADGTLWHDFATGDGGDAVDFFQRASGLSQKAACKKFIELADGIAATVPRTPQTAMLRPEQPKPRPTFPKFHLGKTAELEQLSSLRQIPCHSLTWASERGLLSFSVLKNLPAWIVTDSARLNAQARRLDGQPWEHLDGCPKAWTLPGSWAAWPIGINEAQDFSAIALCEGGPDFLAAHDVAIREQISCAPVAMLGATQRIHATALPLFAGKRVRIFGHDDLAGRAAVDRWATQLVSAGADVDAFSFAGLMRTDGQPVKDLNDSILMDAASLAAIGGFLPL